jgi:predicted DNA-binding protein with PD1-like motif
MTFPLPTGTSHVEVSFGRTPDRTIGAALSVGAVLILAELVAVELKDENRKRLETSFENALRTPTSV